MGHMQFPPLHVMDCAFILAMMKRKCAKKCSDMVCSTATGYSLTLDLKTFLKSMGKKKKYPKIVLTEEEVASIPLIEWEFESKQHHLLIHSWSSNNHATIYQLLTLCKDKGHKLWINNMRRSLHTFKPPDYDLAIWNKFHEFFKEASTPNQYVNASVIILPIIASIYAQNESGDSLEKTYQLFTSNVAQIMKSNPKYTGPSLRSICALFSICCKEIETNDPTKVQKAIDIAMELYKLSIEWKLDLSITTSTDYFNYLFRIFAAAKTSIPDFNVLFDILTHNVNNKILTESTCDALKTYLDTIQNMEIYENLVSDLNGFLFHDEERTQQLMQEPNYHDLGCRTRIWKRLCLLNDESVVRIKMLGASISNDPWRCIIGGLNDGDLFSFDFVDHIDSIVCIMRKHATMNEWQRSLRNEIKSKEKANETALSPFCVCVGYKIYGFVFQRILYIIL
eukprot:1020058_1